MIVSNIVFYLYIPRRITAMCYAFVWPLDYKLSQAGRVTRTIFGNLVGWCLESGGDKCITGLERVAYATA